jgi:hypothetical protein
MSHWVANRTFAILSCLVILSGCSSKKTENQDKTGDWEVTWKGACIALHQARQRVDTTLKGIEEEMLRQSQYAKDKGLGYREQFEICRPQEAQVSGMKEFAFGLALMLTPILKGRGDHGANDLFEPLQIAICGAGEITRAADRIAAARKAMTERFASLVANCAAPSAGT